MDMDEERPRTSIRPPGRTPWIVLAVAVATGLAIAFLWLSRQAPRPPTPAAQPAPVASEAPAPSAVTPVPGDRLRALLDAVSPDPAIRRLLAGEELARRWAVATDNVAEGVVPRRLLAPLGPSGSFSVQRRGDTVVVDPASYPRYDRIGDLAASLDAAAIAAAYRALRPALDAAYRGLGYPEGSIDRATARALARIEAAPVRGGDVDLVPGVGASWAYADPRLEQLPDVERQLLRMGPRNAGIVKEKAREIARALALPPSGR
jgi:hypothetical protein